MGRELVHVGHFLLENGVVHVVGPGFAFHCDLDLSFEFHVGLDLGVDRQIAETEDLSLVF